MTAEEYYLSILQMDSSFKVVIQSSIQVSTHSIYGKVPSGGVHLEVLGKEDLGVSAVRVRVDPQSGQLVGRVV